MAKKLNVELLTKLRDKILANPESYNQYVWGKPSDKAPCGTVACIAGWTFLLEGGTREDLFRFRDEVFKYGYVIDAPDVVDIAREKLGLSVDEGAALFSDGTGWPVEFEDAYDEARTPAERAEVAADYINRIIETGKVD